MEVQKDSPSPTSPGGVSILQEILSQPALCVECGGTLPEPPTEHSGKTRTSRETDINLPSLQPKAFINT